jgi:hypothetical protein
MAPTAAPSSEAEALAYVRLNWVVVELVRI